jgi:hypothetical protein
MFAPASRSRWFALPADAFELTGILALALPRCPGTRVRDSVSTANAALALASLVTSAPYYRPQVCSQLVPLASHPVHTCFPPSLCDPRLLVVA